MILLYDAELPVEYSICHLNLFHSAEIIASINPK